MTKSKINNAMESENSYNMYILVLSVYYDNSHYIYIYKVRSESTKAKVVFTKTEMNNK